MGLKVGGNAVTGSGDFVWKDVVQAYLGERPDDDDIKGSFLKVTWLKGRFQALAADAPEEVITRHVRAYLLYLIGNIILPDKSGSAVQLLYLPLLADLDEANKFSWGSAALAYLYRNLCKASKRGVKEIAGPLLILQLWSWERISIGRPRIGSSHVEILPGVNYPFGSQVDTGHDPLGCRWLQIDREYVDRKLGAAVHRDSFDRMRECEFKWQPYTMEILRHMPAICVEDTDEWIVMAPLICFEVVEWHLPQRCVRQFGWHQTMPGPCDTEAKLHKQDKRQTSKAYNVTYASYISAWNNRKAHLLPRGIPYSGLMSHFDPYLVWFRQITRRIVSPLNENLTDEYLTQHDYRHTSTDMEILAQGHVSAYNISTEALSSMPDDVPIGHTIVFEQLRNLSLQSLQNAHYGHLIQPQHLGNDQPSPDPPRYNLRNTSSQNLTPIQEEDTPSGSSSQPQKKKRSRLGLSFR